jgi:hypothetical protein
MKKTVLLVVLLTLVAFVSGAIAAAPPKGAGTTPPPPPKLEKFTGDIKSVDAMAKSIVVTKPGKVPEDKTFFIDKMTKITKGGKDLPFADLKVGMNVVVEYKKEMDKLIAVTIKATAPKAAPKAK